MAKLTEVKQNIIRKRLLQGVAIKDIAMEVGVSDKTVSRYKKKSPAPFRIEQDTGDNSIIFDYTTSLTKKEEAYVKKIEKELALFEDVDEGWTYHIEKDSHILKTSGMWWSAIAYPESLPSNWLERLKNTGFEVAISPLHDKDTWNHDSPEMVDAATGEIIPKGARYKMGDRKKAHFHLIIKSEVRVGYVEMNNLLRKILNCPYIQKCRSLKNAYEYFLHINAPEKYQGYLKAEIIILNGFRIEPNKYEQGLMLSDLIETVLQHKFTSMSEVCYFFQGQIEYLVLLNAKPFVIQQLVQDNWRKANPDGKLQKYQLVDQEGNVIDFRDKKGKV